MGQLVRVSFPADSSLAGANEAHQMARVLGLQLGFDTAQRLFELESRPVQYAVGSLQRLDVLFRKACPPESHQIQTLGRHVEVRIEKEWRDIAIDSRIAA